MVTVPGGYGEAVAFVAETAIAFLFVLAILAVNHSARFRRYTGFVVGGLLAVYFTLELPLSGMSLNPARTFGAAVVTHIWTGVWIYFTAPLLGMLLGAQVFLWLRGRAAVGCAKMRHRDGARCIFCQYHSPAATEQPPARPAIADLGREAT